MCHHERRQVSVLRSSYLMREDAYPFDVQLCYAFIEPDVLSPKGVPMEGRF